MKTTLQIHLFERCAVNHETIFGIVPTPLIEPIQKIRTGWIWYSIKHKVWSHEFAKAYEEMREVGTIHLN